MAKIILETHISAPAEVCFDLIRDIRIHARTTTKPNEHAVDGVIGGKIGLGQSVTFEGTHFGTKQRLTVKVVEFDRPRLVVDEMIEGSFKAFRHTHELFPEEGGTRMREILTWTSPFGVLGKIVDRFLLKRHLRELVSRRNAKLKEIAERQYA